LETPAADLTPTRGEHLLPARYSKPGARAIRLRIEQIRLPESVALFVYSLDAGGSVGAMKGLWSGASAEQAVVLPGDTVGPRGSVGKRRNSGWPCRSTLL